MSQLAQYKIEGRPVIGGKAWVEMAPGPFTYLEAQREIARRTSAYSNSFMTFEYRAVELPRQEAPKPRRTARRRDLKPGTVFKYLTGWHKGESYEAGMVHPGRPPLSQLGVWGPAGLPISVQAEPSGELCEILWEPEDRPAAAPTTTASGVSPAATAFPQATRTFAYQLGYRPGYSLRPELEELEDEKLYGLDAEVHAEATRRRIQREQQRAITEHNRRQEWLAQHGERARAQFSNFLLGVAHAMACRTALRKYKGHVPYAGKTGAGGEMWRGDEIAQAQQQLGGYAAPWSLEASRFNECMVGKTVGAANWRRAIGSAY